MIEDTRENRGRRRFGSCATVLAGVIGAAAVTNAYRPIVRRWPWSVLGMLSSLASETPTVLAVIQAGSAWRAARLGGIRGRTALILNAFTLVGLFGTSTDAGRSAHALRAALRDTGVDNPQAPPGRPRGVLLGPVARMRYRRRTDIVFDRAHGKFGTLDVWHRSDLPANGRAPVLIEVHGGAWQMGTKAQGSPMMGYFAERGWVCVSVNYRLAPAARWPAMIVDVKKAIAWTRQNIADYGGDPSFIAITGGSAGGHLAALAALTANDPDYQPGFTGIDTTIAAAATLYGVYDFCTETNGMWKLLEDRVFGTSFAADETAWRQASPIRRIGHDAPPFLVLHGSTDAIADVEQSRNFVGQLRAKSPSRVGYAELRHAQHGFDALPTARAAHTINALFQFFQSAHETHSAAIDHVRSTAARL